MPQLSRWFLRLMLIQALLLPVLPRSSSGADEDKALAPPPLWTAPGSGDATAAPPAPPAAGATSPAGSAPPAGAPPSGGAPPPAGAPAPPAMPSGSPMVPAAPASDSAPQLTADPDGRVRPADSPPASTPPAYVTGGPSAVAGAGGDTSLGSAATPGGMQALPSLSGSIGLFRVSTADVGRLHNLRLGLHGEYFRATGFLIQGDTNERLAGGLVAGFTLLPNLELFGALLNASNRNRRDRDMTGDRDPELIKTFGDLVLGGKWVLPLSPAATLGVELGLKFLSGVSDLAVSPRSTSWWLGPLFSYDMRRAGGAPVRMHAGASFYADNSSNLHSLSGPDVTRNTKEAAMFAYGIAPSRLRLALAVDAPLDHVIPGMPIDPFIEYHVAYVTSDADGDFADYMKPNCDSSVGTKMPCIDNRDLQWLTLGVRAAVYRGITADLGVDIRIRSPGFPYGPPVAPWNLVFGVSYPFDWDSLTRTVVVTKTVEKPTPPITDGRITGLVRSARGGGPVGGAVVAVTGRPRARSATDPDGAFATADLPAGLVELEVTAPNFEPTKMTATVVAGQAVDMTIALTPNPPTAKVHGRVSAMGGKGIEASVRFAGDEIREARADAGGAYTVSLPVGSYQVRADAPGLGPKEAQVDLLVGQDKQLDFVLRPVTSNPNVVLAGEIIQIKKPIRFVGATARLVPAAEKLLDALADLLDVHPEMKRIRIVAHWDSGLQKAGAAMLTQHQADAVRKYLIGRGIAEGRLVPVGAGSTKPLVPNLGPANRARNRRVEFHLE